MKKNQKFLKNLLTTASMFSVVALGAGEAWAAGARNVTGVNYNLTTGASLNALWVDDSGLEITAPQDGTTGAGDFDIGAIDTHGQDLSAKVFTIVAGQDLGLGVVVDRQA